MYMTSIHLSNENLQLYKDQNSNQRLQRCGKNSSRFITQSLLVPETRKLVVQIEILDQQKEVKKISRIKLSISIQKYLIVKSKSSTQTSDSVSQHYAFIQLLQTSNQHITLHNNSIPTSTSQTTKHTKISTKNQTFLFTSGRPSPTPTQNKDSRRHVIPSFSPRINVK